MGKKMLSKFRSQDEHRRNQQFNPPGFMRKTILRLFAATLFTTLVFGTATTAQAQKKKGVEKDMGIKGKITAVDATAKTITIAGKTVFIDSTTEIFKSGRLVQMNAILVGTEAQVNTLLLADKLTASSIRLGVPATEGKAPKK